MLLWFGTVVSAANEAAQQPSKASERAMLQTEEETSDQSNRFDTKTIIFIGRSYGKKTHGLDGDGTAR
jgi:hypothetical protein